MKTLEQAFAERQTLYAIVESSARDILLDYCGRRGFLLAGRAKNLESLRDKIETGRYATYLSIDDAIAFSIVIDTGPQEAGVIEFLRNAFDVIAVKGGNTLQDERAFDFDSTRVYCRISDKAKTSSGIDTITIEVQIRTLLQHAWSKITHPYVYKAKSYDPRASRLAAELMAQLESVDRAFSNFRLTAQTVKAVSRRDMTASSDFTRMIDALVADGTIPSELRPDNGRRLGENIYNSIRRNKRGEYSVPLGIVKRFLESQAGRFPRSVSLFQLAIVALHNAHLLEHGHERRPKRYYVTDELISLFPSAAHIPNRVNIE